jgi:hypothetical protein
MNIQEIEKSWLPTNVSTQAELDELKKKNNPDNLPIGHFTGRCGYCASNDLWDDATAYGCNTCGAAFFTGDVQPRIVRNA